MNYFDQYLDDIKKLNILVVGDIMIDKWEYFKSSRLSQEAPVPIVIPDKHEYSLGGAGNVAKNLDILGCNVHLFSLLGSDKYSNLLVNDLIKKTTNINFGFISDHRINTLKRRLIVDNQHFLRIDSEDRENISNVSLNEFKITFNNILKLSNFDAIILQDYDKGFLSSTSIMYIMQICNEKNIKVYIDPKKSKFFNNAWLLKPNKKEFFDISGININIHSNQDIKNEVKEWMEIYNVKNLLITLSENGMILFNNNKTVDLFEEKFIHDNPIDVTGAGDIVISLFTALDLLKSPPSNYDKLYFTSLAAQTSILKRGTSIIDINEMKKFLF